MTQGSIMQWLKAQSPKPGCLGLYLALPFISYKPYAIDFFLFFSSLRGENNGDYFTVTKIIKKADVCKAFRKIPGIVDNM